MRLRFESGDVVTSAVQIVRLAPHALPINRICLLLETVGRK